MKEKEFRKIVREEIKKILSEDFVPREEKQSIISQIYQWIIRGDMQKAIQAMQNDPELLKLAKNVDDLKAELLKRMATNDKFLNSMTATMKKIIDAEKAKGNR